MGDVAVVICKIRMLMCDVLFRNIQRIKPLGIVERHQGTFAMVGLVRRLCAEPSILRLWRYTEQQQAWLVERLGPLVGHGRKFVWEVLDGEWRVETSARRSRSPFLPALLGEMISDEFDLLPLAACLAGAREGF
jgi:hypothetical protein